MKPPLLRRLSVCSIVVFAIATASLVAQTNTFPASGNVGIGTTSPSAKLHVHGGLYLSSDSVPYLGKPISSRLDLANAGGLNSANPFWVGYHFAPPDAITVGGSYSFPRASVFWNYGTASDPTDLTFNISVGNAAAGVPANMRLGLSQPIPGRLFLMAGGADRMTIDSGGNVGIGTESPLARLSVSGTASVNTVNGGGFPAVISGAPTSMNVVHSVGNWGLTVTRAAADAGAANIALFKTRNTDPTVNSPALSGDSIGRISWHAVDASLNSRHSAEIGSKVEAVDGTTVAAFLHFSTTPIGGQLTERVRITSEGNVGIGTGTTNPTHKLAVNGTIKAREVIVETTGWADYVFADDYRLAPLSEVEAHIKAERRLPGIPSEQQVAEQGVSVGEMQAALLAKIEELTLHQIRQEKRLDEQQAEIVRLKSENAALRANN